MIVKKNENLTEKANNSGNPWDYGSTGNFS